MPTIFSSKTPPATEKKPNAKQTVTPVIEQHKPGIFSSFTTHPSGISFANQEANEKMVLFLRRHFITNFKWIFYSILFLFAPPVIFLLFNLTNTTLFSIPSQFLLVLVSFYYILVLNYAFTRFMVWFYHVGIVTGERLIDLDVDNILHYHLAETNIEDIVDVSYSQKGFFQSFFNYGDVPIQTEAIKANFEFEHAPKPLAVADIITDLRPDLKGKQQHDA